MPLCTIAMIAALFAWRWRNDPSLQYMNDYAVAMNLIEAIASGLWLGLVAAFVVPLAVHRVPLTLIAIWMGIAVIAAIGFAVGVNTFPLGPLGFCITAGALVLQRTGAARIPPVSSCCPRCRYDTRGIEPDPCPECGIDLVHAQQLHRRQRFGAWLGSVGLIAVAAFWVWVTAWLWNLAFPID